ncbi:MAG: GGDEF domain-containing protein [Acidobacteriota bacterium]|nr:GGDEF domain-containing protein [Acidobacteriota bacterium]
MRFLLCRDDAERGRLLDLSRRLRPVELTCSLGFVPAIIAGGPTFGWLSSLPIVPGVVLFWIMQGRLPRYRRPELVLLGCLGLFAVGLAAALATASGPRIYLLPLFMIPALLASVVFPLRVAILTTAFVVQLMLGVALLFDLAAVERMPMALLFPLDVMTAGAGLTMIVARLDLDIRGMAVADPLTGLSNRLALRARVAELEHQSLDRRRPVALVIGDPDGFKAINDSLGHSAGDAVLREVAARMLAALPHNASAYRLGGEEFVVLVSDAGIDEALAVAERVRHAVVCRPIDGIVARMSFGVAASGEGQAFSFSALFGLADGALYESKRAGGDRVTAGAAGGREPAPVAGPADAGQAADTADPQDGRWPVPGERDADLVAARPPAGTGDRWALWNEEQHATTGNWLVRDDLQRRQLLELSHLLREKAKVVYLAGFTVGGLAAFHYGWWIILAPLVMAILYVVVETRIDRFSHPEYALGLAWIGFQGSFAISGLSAAHPMIFGSPLFMQLIITSAAVFPMRGVLVGIALTTAMLLVVGFVEDAALLLAAPGIVGFDFALLLFIGLLGAVTGRSTVAYRDLAIVDPLTGLFNRGALAVRAAELAQRPATMSAPVAVVVADIDGFKQLNDQHGHAFGDRVLAAVGERIRQSLRAFESAYRIGGEEFLVLLDDVDPQRARAIADRLRSEIARTPIDSVTVTASFGFATSERGERFDYEAVFLRADAAMYDAKRSGGNRLSIDGAQGMGAGSAGRMGMGIPQSLGVGASSAGS